MYSKRGFVQAGLVVLVAAILLVTAGCTPQAGTMTNGNQPINTANNGTVKGLGGTSDAAANLRTVSVNGTGQAFGTPDVAYIQLGVSTVNADAATAVSQNSSAMAAVIAAVKAMGVEAKDIQTVVYSMWVEQVVDKDGIPTGASRLHVDDQIKVTLKDPSKTGDLIGQAFAAGANTVSSISFAVLDTIAMQVKAREAAVAQAAARAQQLVSGFGEKLGKLRQVNEYSSNPVAVPEAKGYGVRALDSVGAPVETGQFVVTIDVQVVFDIAE